MTLGQTLLQISASLLVFALLLSPTTSMASHMAASSTASFWRLNVASHIVSNNSVFVYTFFSISAHFFALLRTSVV